MFGVTDVSPGSKWRDKGDEAWSPPELLSNQVEALRDARAIVKEDTLKVQRKAQQDTQAAEQRALVSQCKARLVQQHT